jgi:hypothetical protein
MKINSFSADIEYSKKFNNDYMMLKNFPDNFSQTYDIFTKSPLHFSGTSKKLLKSFEKILYEQESGLRNITDREKAVVLDKVGNIVLIKDSDSMEINLNDEDESLFKGNILTHNHPNGTSISLNDFSNAFFKKIKEVRAVTSKSRFSLIMPDGLSLEKANEIATSFATKEWIIALNRDIPRHEVSDIAWKLTAKEMNLDYKRDDW